MQQMQSGRAQWFCASRARRPKLAFAEAFGVHPRLIIQGHPVMSFREILFTGLLSEYYPFSSSDILACYSNSALSWLIIKTKKIAKINGFGLLRNYIRIQEVLLMYFWNIFLCQNKSNVDCWREMSQKKEKTIHCLWTIINQDIVSQWITQRWKVMNQEN